MPNPQHPKTKRLRRAAQAAKLLRICVDERLTGHITFDFKDGHALSYRKLFVHKIPEGEDHPALDGDRTAG